MLGELSTCSNIRGWGPRAELGPIAGLTILGALNLKYLEVAQNIAHISLT